MNNDQFVKGNGNVSFNVVNSGNFSIHNGFGPEVKYEKTASSELKIGGSYLRGFDLDLMNSFIGIASLIVAILSLPSKNDFGQFPWFGVPLIIFMISIFCLVGRRTGTKEFSRLLFDRNLEEDPEGFLSITRRSAECPICRGAVKLKNIKKIGLVGCCVRNPSQHTFSFDPTTFEGEKISVNWHEVYAEDK